MATFRETDYIRVIDDAVRDAESLERFVNGEDDQTVITRLSKEYPTLQKAIKELFGNGGLPATPFKTKALMEASALVDGDYVVVTNDTEDNNGLYIKEGGSWVKSKYSIDEVLNSYGFIDGITISSDTDLNTLVDTGKYYLTGSTGLVEGVNNFPSSFAGLIEVFRVTPLTAKQTYTTWYYGHKYERTMRGGSWESWKKFDDTNDIDTKLDKKLSKQAIALTSESNLNDFKVTETYRKIGSGNIDAEANNYPEPFAGILEVNGDNSLSSQKYTVAHTGKVYTRSFTGSTWTKWKNNDTTDTLPEYTGLHFEWQGTAGSYVSFDNSTKILKIKGHIFTPFRLFNTGRIKVNDVEIDLTNAGQFPVVFLDLDKVLEDKVNDITAENVSEYIQALSYSGLPPQFRGQANLLPIAKYNVGTQRLLPAKGFLPIHNTADNISNDSEVEGFSSTFFEYNKEGNRLNVFFPQSSGNFLRVSVRHILVDGSDLTKGTSDSDLWRIFEAYRLNSEYQNPLLIVNQGEVELAITHEENTHNEVANKDHVGGYHGDEILTDIKFFIDGVLMPSADFVQENLKTASSIQVIQHSVIYFQNTKRPLANHVKDITFEGGKILVKQRLEWEYEDVPLTTAWVTMLPILRTSQGVQITDRSARSVDYYLQVDDNTEAGFGNRSTPVTSGSVIKQWGTTSGVSSEVTLLKTVDAFDEQFIFITDGSGYNKLYVSAIGGKNTYGASTALKGTTWEWDTEYIIKC